jgi:hypothetical protein
LAKFRGRCTYGLFTFERAAKRLRETLWAFVGAPARGPTQDSRKTSKEPRVENPQRRGYPFVARDDRVFLSVREPSPARGWGLHFNCLADIFRINRP